MKSLLIVLCIIVSTSACANDFASHYNTRSTEYSELSKMDGEEIVSMDICVKEAMADDSSYEVDHFEATESCINEVLGDIHN